MMPPTSIDGTDITGATIDGTDVTEITVDGDTVFSAVPPQPPSGLAYWTFDDTDTSGSTTADVWNGNDATINGATTSVSGANDQYTTNEAFDFDGSNDDVVSPSLNLSGVTAMTFACWANLDNTSQKGILMHISNQNDGLVLSYDFALDGFNAFEKINNDFDNGGTTQSVSAGVWHHVVGTYDQSGPMEIYLDGNFEDSGTMDNDISQMDETTVSIGSRDSDKEFFDGQIDDVRVYSKALSASEVSDLYSTGSIL